jgi:putative membrane protein
MIIMIFQLTSSGGTFPTQLTGSSVFQTLHPWMPFTHSIDALRETISARAIDIGLVWQEIGILMIYVVVCLALLVVLRRWSDRFAARVARRQAAAAAHSPGGATAGATGGATSGATNGATAGAITEY